MDISRNKRVIDLLQAEASGDPQKVKEALDTAFTRTELLIGVRFHLSNIPAGSLSVSVYDRIQRLIKEIDRILQR
jgi:hypothetical protein